MKSSKMAVSSFIKERSAIVLIGLTTNFGSIWKIHSFFEYSILAAMRLVIFSSISIDLSSIIISSLHNSDSWIGSSRASIELIAISDSIIAKVLTKID